MKRDRLDLGTYLLQNVHRFAKELHLAKRNKMDAMPALTKSSNKVERSRPNKTRKVWRYPKNTHVVFPLIDHFTIV